MARLTLSPEVALVVRPLLVFMSPNLALLWFPWHYTQAGVSFALSLLVLSRPIRLTVESARRSFVACLIEELHLRLDFLVVLVVGLSMATATLLGTAPIATTVE